MKSYIKIILSTIVCLMIFACSKSGKDENKVVGKWKIEKFTADGGGYKFELMDNGSYLDEFGGESGAGTWELLKDPLRLVFDNGMDKDTVNIKFTTEDEMEWNCPKCPGPTVMTASRVKK